MAQPNNKQRSIGRWFIGETLGKGGYSWVKKGADKKTGKIVALKFMAKADSSWADEQTKQVITEIESLKNIRHRHVMKLYAYNLNAKYPELDGSKIETILLVLEFAPGGELFDILYYTKALEENISRTYFRQLISGLEACHNAGVVHRDLKPQNLLLDSRFNLKITDFGLSKVFESDEESIMKTTYVGTKGYQAPELLLNKRYDLSCDIFSCGVVLFILLCGYPPFEQASAKDRWYSKLAQEKPAEFWHLHRKSKIAKDANACDLLQRMLAFNPKKRITIVEIKKHPWFQGKFLEGNELIQVLRVKHREMELKRQQDSRKMKELQNSVKHRDLPGLDDANMKLLQLPLFPENCVEGIFDTYSVVHWSIFFTSVLGALTSFGAKVTHDWANFTIQSTLKMQANAKVKAELLVVDVQLWRSREYKDVKFPSEEIDSDNEEEDEEEEKDEQKSLKGDSVNLIRIRRVQGGVTKFKQFENMLMKKCAAVFTGLPLWAQEQVDAKKQDLVVVAPKEEEEEEDDYDKLLAEEE